MSESAPVLTSDQLRSIEAREFDVGSVEEAQAVLEAEFGPLPWRFEACGANAPKGKAGVIAHGLRPIDPDGHATRFAGAYLDVTVIAVSPASENVLYVRGPSFSEFEFGPGHTLERRP